MKIKLAVGLLFILAQSAMATPSIGTWEMTSQTFERATNSTEFLRLQQKYPNSFGSFQTRLDGYFYSASISNTTYRYQGASACKIDDPKLFKTLVATSVCGYGKPGKVECDLSMAHEKESTPWPFDPCGN